jgi:hypothetical protein
MGQDEQCQMGPYAAGSSDTAVTKAGNKKLVTGSVARAKPTRGQLSYWWGDFKPHPREARTRYTCRAGISVLKLRQYTTVSFVNREMPEIDLKHARLDFVSHRKHATSLLQITTSQIRFRGITAVCRYNGTQSVGKLQRF